MRILYHHRTRGEDAQGIHIRALCDAFRRLGHEVDVVALARSAPAPKPASAPARAATGAGENDSRPQLLGVPIPYWFYELLALAYNGPAFAWLLFAALRRRPAFIYERYTLFTFAGLLVAKLLRLPFVLEVNAPLSLELTQHGNLTFRRLAERIETALCRNATRTLVVTQAMADIFIARGVPAERLQVIPNGVDGERFNPDVSGAPIRERYGLSADTPVVGFVGWIRPWHGVDGLIGAVGRLVATFPELRLLVVGDGPAVPALRQQARDAGLDAHVIFTGPVARDDIPGHIAALDVAVQPDVTDYASPIKLFEYLALGRAVVAPDKANIREVVRHGRSALLFPPRDWAAMERAIGELLTDPEQRARMAAAAAQLVDERGYTWMGNARQVLEIVQGPAEHAPAEN
ncbi:glycosyltransferase family 4 protein [Aquisalimonas asiatica]|uniref:Glycosyltransferase involved in cell wall bisynthesis n=1 Tax=Aquisalimonas asiatica TaxID=406100 RepID=A0A1H8U458_9GAMM|nr:glycosyltransferase family 4 protein [Aquisalimonas asiatica]SEO97846.1 Glycosyltransferase involved in cell wall bisynthesis [Aquisalimonas asiatica]